MRRPGFFCQKAFLKISSKLFNTKTFIINKEKGGERVKKETRTICYDEELGVEAYRLEGVTQAFPTHFHECYVVGLLEAGSRHLVCRGSDHWLQVGDLVLFNPSESHACSPVEEVSLDYRGLNLPVPVMRVLAREITGGEQLPAFTDCVARDEELAGYLRPLHQMIMEGSREFEKEELLLLLAEKLLKKYSRPFDQLSLECSGEVEAACALMEQRFGQSLSLEELCRHCGLSRSTLLRAFVRQKGITPYRYLETLRVNQARRLLEQGLSPADAALSAGFADQSHFTNFFTRFTGLSPGAYRSIFWSK